ncbi:hypothetical protein AB6A40_006950 [Gnathostoma spinigerum]|uniref:ShKT domain-containing protein n=1 Tax=Gnathostoma spinigerum TaxID=75299 RepID=A0ABD6EKF3_9BILA
MLFAIIFLQRVHGAIKTCEDYDVDCANWVQKAGGLCDPWLMRTCEISCGKCSPSRLEIDVEKEFFISQLSAFDSVPPACQNAHRKCETWAEEGECLRIPKIMHSLCCKSCLRVK